MAQGAIAPPTQLHRDLRTRLRPGWMGPRQFSAHVVLQTCAVAALVALLPAVTPPLLRHQVDSPPITLSLHVQDLAAGLLLLSVLARPSALSGPRGSTLLLVIAGCGLGLLGMLSVSWSQVPLSSAERGIRMLVMLVTSFAVMASRGAHGAAAVTWVVCAVIHASVAILQFTLQRSLGLVWLGEPQWDAPSLSPAIIDINGEQWARGTGLTAHPNVLGTYLAVGLIVGLPLALQARGRGKLLVICAIITIAIGLLVSFSRGGWVSSVVGLAWLLIWMLRRAPGVFRAHIPTLLMVTAILAVIAASQWHLIAARTLIAVGHLGWSALPYEAADLQIRSTSFNYANWVVSTSPLLGVGLAAYRIGVFSTPVWIATELGVLGLLLWMGWWLAALRTGWSVSRSAHGDLAAATSVAVLLALLVSGIFNPDGWTAESGRLSMALWVGLAAAGGGGIRLPCLRPGMGWVVRAGTLILTLGFAASLALVSSHIQFSGLGARGDICPEPNEHPLNACAIVDGASVQGYLETHFDADAYLFWAPEHGTRVRAELHELPADYDLYLLDRRGGVIASSTREGRTCDTIDLNVSAGAYILYIWVDPGRAHVAASPYRLSLWFPPEHLWGTGTGWHCATHIGP